MSLQQFRQRMAKGDVEFNFPHQLLVHRVDWRDGELAQRDLEWPGHVAEHEVERANKQPVPPPRFLSGFLKKKKTKKKK